MIKAVAGALAMMTTVPAMAQAGVDPTTWTGFYVGGRIGYSFQPNDRNERINFDNNLDGNFPDIVRTAAGVDAFSPGFCGGRARGATPMAGCAKDEDSLEFALHAGYDFDLGKIVVGVVGEGGYGFAEDHVSAFSTTPASYTMTRRMGWNYGVRGRLGYALGANRNTLIYGTGGVLWAHMENRFRSTNTLNAYRVYGDDHVFGWRAGAGVEQRVLPHLSVGLQYLFTSLKDNDARVRVTRGAQPATNPFVLVNADGTDFARSHSRFAAHNLSATANFRF